MGVSDEGLDPDLAERPAEAPAPVRPAYLRAHLLALIAAGGAGGTWLRAVLEEALPSAPAGWPWATFTVNVSGALVLGFLLEALARSGPDSGWRRRLRLGAGTGFLGGYTTYSTFAVEVSQVTHAAPAVGLAYAAASLVLGPAAAALGYLAARRLVTRPAGRRAW